MGRTLPWKRQGAATKNAVTTTTNNNTNNHRSTSSPRASPAPSIPSTPRRRVKTSATNLSSGRNTLPSLDTLDDGCGEESPAKIPTPLPQSLMISGLQHDDKWRMVEDEFVAMAHKFTAHLHAAEYQRLKKLAQDQNADAIQSLSRPVTMPMTGRVKRRQAVVSLQRSQKTGIKRALSRAQDAQEDEVDELPWAGTNLEGLMDSPRKKMVPLNRMVSTASGTRAAALSRKDSIPSPKATRRRDSIQQKDSPTTTRKHSVRFNKSLSPITVPGSSNDFLQRTSSTAQGRASSSRTPPDLVQDPSPAPVASNVDDDSDSPVETMFGQHFRERCNKSRVKSSTPGTSDSQRSEDTSTKRPGKSSLSVPSI